MIGYVMFRNPSTQYGHWGFVVKGGDQEIAVLVKVEQRCEFELYDQRVRQTIKSGEVVHLEFEWVNNEPEDDAISIINALV